jgi:hypothetical protein
MSRELVFYLGHQVIIIIIVKSRRLGWIGHLGRLGETKYVFRILWGNSEKCVTRGTENIDARIILKKV